MKNWQFRTGKCFVYVLFCLIPGFSQEIETIDISGRLIDSSGSPVTARCAVALTRADLSDETDMQTGEFHLHSPAVVADPKKPNIFVFYCTS